MAGDCFVGLCPPRNDGLYVNVIARVLAPVAISGMRTE